MKITCTVVISDGRSVYSFMNYVRPDFVSLLRPLVPGSFFIANIDFFHFDLLEVQR